MAWVYRQQMISVATALLLYLHSRVMWYNELEI